MINRINHFDMMKKLPFLTLTCIFLMTVQVRAEITPQLINEWNKQPSNVQWSVFYQNTSLNVVDKLPWESPDLAETWAYTSKYKDNNGLVNHIDIVVKRGYESALTHEVGHCLEDQNRVCNWWAYRPEFIQIWQQERYNCPLLFQGLTDIREYFACSYDVFINYRPILKQCCPQTYNYIRLVLRYK